MKTFLALTAATLAASAYGASAQSVVDLSTRPSPRHERQADENVRSPRAHDDADRKREWRADRRAEQSPIDEGARFSIANGNSKIEFQCPAAEPMKECAHVMLQVIDRMGNKASIDAESDEYEQDRPRYREGS